MFLLSFISIIQTDTVRPHTTSCAKNISIRVDSNMLLKIVAHTINVTIYGTQCFECSDMKMHFVPSGNEMTSLKCG